MTELVSCHIEDNVATINISNGKANAISPQVIEQLHKALDLAEQQKCVVVLTGQVGIFSAGYDLKIMGHSQQDAIQLVQKGSQLALRLLAFPLPVIAACNGHAVAKGAFLLLASDYRIGVAGDFKIGLNEVAIGMPMHHFGIELAKFRMSPRYVHRSLLLAEMFSPKQALEAGFLDKLVNSDDFADEVQVLAQSMTNLDMSAHGKTKQHARRPILAKLQQCIEQDLRP